MEKSRQIRKNRIKNKIHPDANRPRLLVFRSNSEISALIIDFLSGKVLASASSFKNDQKQNKTLKAKTVGEEIGKKALEKKIVQVVFDRRGYKYHGRVAALADGARAAGLKF